MRLTLRGLTRDLIAAEDARTVGDIGFFVSSKIFLRLCTDARKLFSLYLYINKSLAENWGMFCHPPS